MGSAVMLWGDPGDTIVELRHLKQPIDEIGPWNIRHDHAHGDSSIEKSTDLIEIVLRSGTQGLTAVAAASLVYETETPKRNEIERTRAKLDRLAGNDRLVKFPGTRGNDAPRYVFNGPAEALQ
jgi:replicative DNA helicase